MQGLVIMAAVSIALMVALFVLVFLGIAWSHAPFSLKTIITELIKILSGK